jgi:YbgC/YbaW family acyl-CoA thioester hydrolase
MSVTLNTRPFMIEMDIKVRTYDIDSGGHVSNIKYLYWMEDMRLEVLEKHLPMQPLLEQGYQPVIIETNIEYKRAVKLFDKPKGYMWVRDIGKVSYLFEGEIYVNGELATHAIHKGVFLDTQTGRPRKLPPEFLQRFLKAQAELSR